MMRDAIYQEVARANRLHRLEIRYKGVGALLLATLVCLSTVLAFSVALGQTQALLAVF
jgi:hypothetical protein